MTLLSVNLSKYNTISLVLYFFHSKQRFWLLERGFGPFVFCVTITEFHFDFETVLGLTTIFHVASNISKTVNTSSLGSGCLYI